jgi:hypothetical protein
MLLAAPGYWILRSVYILPSIYDVQLSTDFREGVHGAFEVPGFMGR